MEPEIVYEKLPTDIAERFVLLMDPILGSGNSAARAIQVGRQGPGQGRGGTMQMQCCLAQQVAMP
jgi:uracil phosphoribosyltransferase